jgi:hypothetical protein
VFLINSGGIGDDLSSHLNGIEAHLMHEVLDPGQGKDQGQRFLHPT